MRKVLVRRSITAFIPLDFVLSGQYQWPRQRLPLTLYVPLQIPMSTDRLANSTRQIACSCHSSTPLSPPYEMPD